MGEKAKRKQRSVLAAHGYAAVWGCAYQVVVAGMIPLAVLLGGLGGGGLRKVALIAVFLPAIFVAIRLAKLSASRHTSRVTATVGGAGLALTALVAAAAIKWLGWSLMPDLLTSAETRATYLAVESGGIVLFTAFQALLRSMELPWLPKRGVNGRRADGTDSAEVAPFVMPVGLTATAPGAAATPAVGKVSKDWAGPTAFDFIPERKSYDDGVATSVPVSPPSFTPPVMPVPPRSNPPEGELDDATQPDIALPERG